MEVITAAFKYKVFPDDIAPRWQKVMTDSADFLLKQGLVKQLPAFKDFMDDTYLRTSPEYSVTAGHLEIQLVLLLGWN
jgi:hypothetical protein